MILKNFEYSEFDGLPNEWSLKGLYLEKVNLLVGKNASGKSRTLNRIIQLADMLTGTQSFSLDVVDSACFLTEYVDGTDIYQYVLKTMNRAIVDENLTITKNNHKTTFLTRGENGKGEIIYTIKNEKIEFQLPSNQPAALLKRDILQHPFLEKIFEWTNGIRYFSFGTSTGQGSFLAPQDMEKIEKLSAENRIRDTNNASALYLAGKNEFGKSFDDEIIECMGKIGYSLSNIALRQNPFFAIQLEDNNPIFMMSVNETDRKAHLFQSQMSQGMFRALFLIIQIAYNLRKNISKTIIIDDIGEGLDFDRSSRLIKLLIEIAEKNDNIQLIMSTNDRFVMNKVPFKYWQLINRRGGECCVYNYENSREIFDEFKYTGLNNFDFLETDFISDFKRKMRA
jgi:energy-coupling factor transporter ATP-binding protein EcfA2